MEKSIGRKIILCVLDCVPKSAQEIADNIGEPLENVEAQLARLVGEDICEEVCDDEVSLWIVKKEIETFAQLVRVFLSNKAKEKRYEEISQFITSTYYHSNFDHDLVNYVLRRFHLQSVYQIDKHREALRRILLVSPSALFFALHSDTELFDQLQTSQNQLDSTDSSREWFFGIRRSQFQAPIVEMLISDMKVLDYGALHAQLQLQVAQQTMHVSLATPTEKFVEVFNGGSFSLVRAMEEVKAGQLLSVANPITFSNQGLALMHLGDFPSAIHEFDKALNVIEDSLQKAIVLNNKGWALLNLKQYQKAIECFELGIRLDPEGEFSPLRENKRVAEDHLKKAAETHNFNQPTQARFHHGQPVAFEETRFYEFKEVSSKSPVSSIENTADEYAVSFLNREGGRLFWGIRDIDRITVGVTLDDQARNKTRRQVSQKLCQIQPPISVKHWRLEFHVVHDLRGQVIPNLWVLELVVLPPQEKEVFYTGGWEVFVKTEGGKQKLQGPALTEFIQTHLENDKN